MRILFVASEGLPFSKTGGLADVIEALPKTLAAMGHQVAVLLPRYKRTPATGMVVSRLSIAIGGSTRNAAILDGGVVQGVQYFFVDDPGYFDRDQLYGTTQGDYPDNAERYAEFSRAAIQVAAQLWKPDVLHCHDWQAALVPALLRTQYENNPELQATPVVLTIHNVGYQGVFPREVMARAGLPEVLFNLNGLEFYDQVSYLKGGLLFADALTTVSRRYAEEIQTPEFGHGLEGVVRSRADRLTGILNGVDYSAWDPQHDPLIAARYSAQDLAGKRECKKNLLDMFGLPVGNLRRPIAGIVSRFVDQKGFDLLDEVADELLEEELVVMALGTGDAKHERKLRDLARRYPARMAVKIAYDNPLAHKIEAGADLFLMPSRYEPCGLNQIYSLRYGTVPVVRATGGLDDTIEAYDARSGQGTGFKFQEYTGEAFLQAVQEALAVYRDKKAWRGLQVSGMAKDFSWKASAAEYARLYETARELRIRAAVSASN
jgi:starch synthase